MASKEITVADMKNLVDIINSLPFKTIPEVVLESRMKEGLINFMKDGQTTLDDYNLKIICKPIEIPEKDMYVPEEKNAYVCTLPKTTLKDYM